ncbi:hypothetical protein MIU24_05415, partial [Streptomyces venezuelae]|uniref:hypothetical protein n=1 Tax=Streptomyces sp. B6(2022) TaxID=3404749 RepID=UPI00311D7FE8
MLHRDPLEDGTIPPGNSAVRAALIFVLLTSLICGAVAAGVLWSAGVQADRERAAHRHQVQATTTGPAKDPPTITRSGATAQARAP